jgi:protein required for attachment to host cells
VKIRSDEWVVVCDGGKALILVNSGDAMVPNLKTVETYEHDNAKTSAQGTDKPGRVHESATNRRSSVEQTDWHDAAERDFLHTLARHLDEALRAGKTKALIVVAAKRALGVLREAYTDAVRKAVKAELAKDYTNKPVHEIEKLLASEDT